ncbi:MAG: NADP-dependent isocitrate dehydrogenase [Anaerolineales bacterium]|jgi:isocitrate dehydrogenase
MAEAISVTVARGDGIGPEIMDATLKILSAAQVNLNYEFIDIGEKVYQEGYSSGIKPESWESLRRTKVFLKSPITTPQGGGVKSLNVTIRKTLGLYANIRPCQAYDPYVATKHPHIDIVIIRENEEDLYGGIEHRQTNEVYQCLKLITRPGSERIIRYAFEYTRRRGWKKLSCFTKDNIMKLTDGLFHSVFAEISQEYPEIETEHMIVDIGMARLADKPEQFQVIVLENLYGDILSDIAAEISGSVGLAGSANVGDHGAMFEAIHGSAPDIAGKDLANPSGLLLAAVKMLAHIGQVDSATHIHNAWLKTIEDGIHTGDIYTPERSKKRVGTQAFAQAVIERLGEVPTVLRPATYLYGAMPEIRYNRKSPEEKQLVGVDVFVDWPGDNPSEIADMLRAACPAAYSLEMITNRGVKVWPEGFPETFCTDHWRCRFLPKESGIFRHIDILELLNALNSSRIDFIKTENLYEFDGVPGFSLGQGQ